LSSILSVEPLFVDVCEPEPRILFHGGMASDPECPPLVGPLLLVLGLRFSVPLWSALGQLKGELGFVAQYDPAIWAAMLAPRDLVID
jgi:hypothetical protein